jgi:hypothetical protein
VKKKKKSGSRSALTDKELQDIVDSAKAGKLRIKVLTPGDKLHKAYRWQRDKIVPTGWNDRNITGFADEEDVTW